MFVNLIGTRQKVETISQKKHANRKFYNLNGKLRWILLNVVWI
jgi:hypothetical protein